MSALVRVLVAAATVWAALTLWIIGVSSTSPLLAIPVTLIGHWVAVKAILKRMPWISMMIAGTIMTTGVTMRFELVEALQGNRIPVDNFLLIAGSASVFDARTRAGLYTQLVFSGLVMFFAAEKAFGNEFVGLLGGNMTILFILLATAQYVDLTSGASVKAISNRFGSMVYWSAAGVVVVVATFVSFMILPWDTSQTPQAARQRLPVNGRDSPLPNIDPETAQSMLDDQDGQQMGQLEINPDLFGQSGNGDAVQSDIFGEVGDAKGDIHGIPLIGKIGGGDRVAFVRSSVASYWRGRTYDTFDPKANDDLGIWYSTLDDDRKFQSLFGQSSDATAHDRYLLTFFLQDDLDTNLLTGYGPLAIAVPHDNRWRMSLTPGSTYQVVSKQPETDPDILRRDRGEWISREYGVIPQGSGELQSLTAALTKSAENDFDKASAITSYLQNLEYDELAESARQPSTDLNRYIIGALPRTCIDFASALTLITRSAGLQSRVATGYLPGEYN